MLQCETTGPNWRASSCGRWARFADSYSSATCGIEKKSWRIPSAPNRNIEINFNKPRGGNRVNIITYREKLMYGGKEDRGRHRRRSTNESELRIRSARVAEERSRYLGCISTKFENFCRTLSTLVYGHISNNMRIHPKYNGTEYCTLHSGDHAACHLSKTLKFKLNNTVLLNYIMKLYYVTSLIQN